MQSMKKGDTETHEINGARSVGLKPRTSAYRVERSVADPKTRIQTRYSRGDDDVPFQGTLRLPNI